MKREEIYEYVKKQYGTVPEYLWKESLESAVLRHPNGKWYAVLMQVEKSRLGLEGDTKVDIIDVECDPDMVGLFDADLWIFTRVSYEQKVLDHHAAGWNRKRGKNLRLFGYEL